MWSLSGLNVGARSVMTSRASAAIWSTLGLSADDKRVQAARQPDPAISVRMTSSATDAACFRFERECQGRMGTRTRRGADGTFVAVAISLRTRQPGSKMTGIWSSFFSTAFKWASWPPDVLSVDVLLPGGKHLASISFINTVDIATCSG